MERAHRIVADRLRPECWREWKGPEFGNQGGQTIGWADENVRAWLERLNPEVVIFMFGTNDLPNLEADEYRNKLRSVVRKCLDRGTVVILSTIPPRHGFAAKAVQFAEAARQVARELSVPLVDYHAEILKRRPNDWDGTLVEFKGFEGHDVPTLLARDGVHPSAPRIYQDDYSEQALRSSGYALRNYIVLMKYAEVIEALSTLGPDNPDTTSRGDAEKSGDSFMVTATPSRLQYDRLPAVGGRVPRFVALCGRQRVRSVSCSKGVIWLSSSQNGIRDRLGP
jgi:hypothetical protein